MFKKTLVALGLSVVAVQGMAATIAAAPKTTEVSPQAIETAPNVSGAKFEYVTGAAIASGSVLNLTFSAAPSNPASIDAAVTEGSAGGGQCPTNGDDTLTYSGVTNDGKTLNYTFITKDGNPAGVATVGGAEIGCKFTFGTTTKAAFKKADVDTAGITVGGSFTVVGAGVDPTSPLAPAKLLKLGKDQYSLATTTAAAAVIDVNAPALRKAYVGGGTDKIRVTHKDLGTGATSPSSKIVITGDFSWADDAATPGFQIKGTAIALAVKAPAAILGTGTNKPTASTITIIDPSPVEGDWYELTFTPQASTLAVELPVGAFGATSTVAYTDTAASTGSYTATATGVGAWSLNGAIVKVFSVPFGPEVESHSIFVSNSGKTTGEITASMVWAGNDAVTLSLGNIEPNANMYVNLKAALEAAGELPPFGRADVTFTVNAPAGDITMTAAYNTAEGRANLFMQEQANIASISSAAKTSAAAAAKTAATTCANLTVAEDNLDDIAGNSTAFASPTKLAADGTTLSTANVKVTTNGSGAGTDPLTACD